MSDSTMNDSTDTEPDFVPSHETHTRRTDVDRLSVEKDLSLVGPVEAG